jgi:hypothetical protein
MTIAALLALNWAPFYTRASQGPSKNGRLGERINMYGAQIL